MIKSQEVATVGLNPQTWGQVKRNMLNTGQFDPELWNELSDKQRYWVNETKKTLRQITCQ